MNYPMDFARICQIDVFTEFLMWRHKAGVTYFSAEFLSEKCDISETTGIFGRIGLCLLKLYLGTQECILRYTIYHDIQWELVWAEHTIVCSSSNCTFLICWKPLFLAMVAQSISIKYSLPLNWAMFLLSIRLLSIFSEKHDKQCPSQTPLKE